MGLSGKHEAQGEQEQPEGQSNLKDITEQAKEATECCTQGKVHTTGSTDQ